MTKDFAKPSTTRKPGDQKKPGPSPSANPKTKKSKPITKKSSSATLKQNQPTPQSKRTKSITLLIILISAFTYGLYYLQSIPPTKSLPDTAPKSGIKKEANIQAPLVEKKPDARFKFYDLLPESKIQPSEVDVYQFKDKNKQTKYSYLVQTGSFRNEKDAERQKATIAFKGIKANITVITSNNGGAWFRVVAGPYNNRSKMNSVLDKLVSINIQPLVKKVKK
ncbi:MAG: cell division protein FtsN [Oleiphilaceae bacterium]|jgi:cell division protein FtsN